MMDNWLDDFVYRYRWPLTIGALALFVVACIRG